MPFQPLVLFHAPYSIRSVPGFMRASAPEHCRDDRQPLRSGLLLGRRGMKTSAGWATAGLTGRNNGTESTAPLRVRAMSHSFLRIEKLCLVHVTSVEGAALLPSRN